MSDFGSLGQPPTLAMFTETPEIRHPKSSYRVILVLMEIRGKTALITGGASGLGAACAKMIAAAGGRVVIADLQPGADLGDSALFALTDVTDTVQVQAAISAAIEG